MYLDLTKMRACTILLPGVPGISRSHQDESLHLPLGVPGVSRSHQDELLHYPLQAGTSLLAGRLGSA